MASMVKDQNWILRRSNENLRRRGAGMWNRRLNGAAGTRLRRDSWNWTSRNRWQLPDIARDNLRIDFPAGRSADGPDFHHCYRCTTADRDCLCPTAKRKQLPPRPKRRIWNKNQNVYVVSRWKCLIFAWWKTDSSRGTSLRADEEDDEVEKKFSLWCKWWWRAEETPDTTSPFVGSSSLTSTSPSRARCKLTGLKANSDPIRKRNQNQNSIVFSI